MSEKSLILVGNPDSGKTNYLAMLWLALQTQNFAWEAPIPPSNIKYVEDIAAHILQGRFVPRTDQEESKREFRVSVRSKDQSETARLYIPDVSGEMWKKAVNTLEIPQKWMTTLTNASGALLFVRVLSDLNVQPLDWVTTQGLIKAGLVDDSNSDLPTQVSLVELFRFLEENLGTANVQKPKVAIMVTAWDLMNKDDSKAGPDGYLSKQFPMFAGRLKDESKLDVKVFGLSIVGGDFTVEEFLKKYLEDDPESVGYAVTRHTDDTLKSVEDITSPFDWLLK